MCLLLHVVRKPAVGETDWTTGKRRHARFLGGCIVQVRIQASCRCVCEPCGNEGVPQPVTGAETKSIGHTSDCTWASAIEKISAHPHLFR